MFQNGVYLSSKVQMTSSEEILKGTFYLMCKKECLIYFIYDILSYVKYMYVMWWLNEWLPINAFMN